MVLWHIGGALFLFRWIFRDPSVDVRYLAAGAVLPDVVDLPVGTLLTPWSTGEVWLHTLAVPALAGALVMLATRRGPRRRALLAVPIGMFFHLLLDGMWTTGEVFAWPFFGWDFPPGPDPYWAGAVERAVSDPWRWAAELAGLAYLAWIWLWAGLGDAGRRGRFWATGRLEPVAA
jgi:hypothetical protein